MIIKNILFDFDGVILDSMPVRELGFRKLFEAYEPELVEQLIAFHEANGGLSRYVKIRYFHEELLGQTISEEEVMQHAQTFSEIMKEALVDKRLLIAQSVAFIRRNTDRYCLHIVSGSDQAELRYLCAALGIAEYFHSIHGSPTPKKQLVASLLETHSYELDETILIGDSINDYEAADVNGIAFYGYNNKALVPYSKIYLEDYTALMPES